VYTALRARVGADPKPRYLLRYRPSPAWRARLPIGDRRRVALITGQGTIRLGGAPRAGLAPSMLAGRICAALRAAREDPRIAAVVFRVNSPGGSYVASDAVAREVGCCRAAGKPVVVTMGEVAASGGYFVAAPADVIVAQPATVTGSIGVLGGKPVLAELLARIGVSHDAIETDPAARMMSVLRRFSDAERSRFAEFLDAIYADFVAKVAAGRGLSPAAVDAVARGRVWTGADAAERGLVDVLGGITEAAGIARERAGLAADAPLVRYPDPGGWRRLRPPASSADPRPAAGTGPLAGSGVAASSALLAGTGLLPGSDWGPLAGLAAELGLPGSGLLTMPALPLP
jgi:protease-4